MSLMNARFPEHVIVREVGMRDGLQSIATILPTAKKIEWLEAAHAAGQREIEVGSFVPAKLLPQLADTAEVVAFAKTLPGLVVSVLVPNLKGAEKAIESGAHVLLVPVSASHAHSLANVRKTPDDAIAEVARIRHARDAAGSKIVIEVGISTAFGCTIQGRVAPSEVLRLVQAALDAGADRVGLADTVGYADPRMVRELFEQALRVAGDRLCFALLSCLFLGELLRFALFLCLFSREFLCSLELGKNQPLTHMYYAWLLAMAGRKWEAGVQAKRAQDLDPLSPLINSGAGWAQFMNKDFSQAVDECQRCLDVDPDFLVGLYVMALCYTRMGMRSEAAPLIEKAVRLSGRAPFYLGLVGLIYAQTGDTARAIETLAELDQMAQTGRYVPPHCYVYIYAGLRDFDRAFEWQAKACEDGAPPFYFLSPAIDMLHDDWRHKAHLQRMRPTG